MKNIQKKDWLCICTDWGVKGFQKLQINEKAALDLELTTQQQFHTETPEITEQFGIMINTKSTVIICTVKPRRCSRPMATCDCPFDC